MKLTIACVAVAALLAGCNQQAQADLAVCKGDLARASSDATAAKTAADQKIAGLETQLKQAQDQLAANQQVTDAAAAKAAEEKAAADAKAAGTKTAAQKKAAEVKKAAEGADLKVKQPVKDMTTQEKAKAAGF